MLKQQAAQRLSQIELRLDAHAGAVIASWLVAWQSSPAFPGLGEITAIALSADMPEFSSMDPKQAASLASLALATRQSGTLQGKSFIRDSRAHVCQGLYRPALVVDRFNPDHKPRFNAMIDAGKPAKLAMAVLMRRLVVLALLRDNRTWASDRG